jgi:hypothetical protein
MEIQNLGIKCRRHSDKVIDDENRLFWEKLRDTHGTDIHK